KCPALPYVSGDMRPSLQNGPPSPEEFQRQLNEFMRQHFPRGATSIFPRADEPGPEGPAGSAGAADAAAFEFHYKPRDVRDYLDRFVIKQDEAKRVLSVALCDHYH